MNLPKIDLFLIGEVGLLCATGQLLNKILKINSSIFAKKVKRVKISPINIFHHQLVELGNIFDHVDSYKMHKYLIALHSFDGNQLFRKLAVAETKEIVNSF